MLRLIRKTMINMKKWRVFSNIKCFTKKLNKIKVVLNLIRLLLYFIYYYFLMFIYLFIYIFIFTLSLSSLYSYLRLFCTVSNAIPIFPHSKIVPLRQSNTPKLCHFEINLLTRNN